MSKCYSTKEEREKIILENERLVYHVFKQMNMTFRIDDMFDIGLIGLINGVDTFDCDKGYQLSTYLVQCIRNELNKQIQYERVIKRQAEIVSFEKPIFAGNEKITLEDTLGYEVDIDEQLINEEIFNIIDHRLYFLPERNEKIFKHIYGLDGYKKLSYGEISKKFGISQQRITDIRTRIIRMLKYQLRKYN